MKPTLSLSSGQLHYLQSVLGLSDFIRPVLPAVALQAQSPRLFALFPVDKSEFPLRKEVSELIVKMIRAMNLDRDQVVCGEWVHDLAAADLPVPDQIRELIVQAVETSRPVVIFGAQGVTGLLSPASAATQPGDWVDIFGARTLITHSPIELLSSPGADEASLVGNHFLVLIN
jgi:hypothetical protein